MKTDDLNDTLRDSGDEGVRNRFDQRRPYDRAEAWPEPDMAVLRLQRRDAPNLPIEIFGERWSGLIRNNAEASACPMDYVAAPLLAAASAVIGHARWPRAGETWAEPPHLWCASVGDSGDGKSPGADMLYRHVMPEMERRLAIDFPDQLREAQAATASTTCPGRADRAAPRAVRRHDRTGRCSARPRRPERGHDDPRRARGLVGWHDGL